MYCDLVRVLERRGWPALCLTVRSDALPSSTSPAGWGWGGLVFYGFFLQRCLHSYSHPSRLLFSCLRRASSLVWIWCFKYFE